MAAGGQRRAAIEDTDVVQPQKTTLEDIAALSIFFIDPPGEVHQQLVKHPFQKMPVGPTLLFGVDLVDPPGRPGVHRRIDVAQFPFVGRQRPVGMHVPFAGHQTQLALCKARIHQGQRDRVKGQIPGRVPRVLPLVRHGNDIEVVEVFPLMIPPAESRWGHLGRRRVALQPLLHIVVKELLGPDHACQGLTLNRLFIEADVISLDRCKKCIGFVCPTIKNRFIIIEGGL